MSESDSSKSELDNLNGVRDKTEELFGSVQTSANTFNEASLIYLNCNRGPPSWPLVSFLFGLVRSVSTKRSPEVCGVL